MRTTSLMVKVLICMTALSVIWGGAAHAVGVTFTWTGGVDNDWGTDGNWDESGAPGVGDLVVINAGTPLLSSATPALESVVINGGTLAFTNWNTKLTAYSVTIKNGGTITHGLNSATSEPWTPDARVWIACTNLTVELGGAINADNKGYTGLAASPYGRGPGKPIGQYSGPGHGGRGSGGVGGNLGGLTHGSLTEPEDPGSSGSQPGGGVIRIDAIDAFTLNGTISASATINPGSGQWGAGGSILINCRTLEGTTGKLRAACNSLASGTVGIGGGGRIAVVYDPVAQAVLETPVIGLDAGGGINSNYSYRQGQPGTVYLPDQRLIPALINTNFAGIFHVPDDCFSFPADLTVSNTWAGFRATNLTVKGNIRVFGTISSSTVMAHALDLLTETTVCQSDVFINKASIRQFAGGTVEPPHPNARTEGFGGIKPHFNVSGNMALTNDARFWVYAGPTNGAPAEYGAQVKIDGDLSIAVNAWILPFSHPTNGGSVMFAVSNLWIGSGNTGFDANGMGYGRPYRSAGYGPGGGLPDVQATVYGHGAGYGGRGGSGLGDGTGGGTYGSEQYPLDPGSGGGSYHGGGSYDGRIGGGLIWVEVDDTATIHGTMRANGSDGVNIYGGMGSGGGIYLKCHTLAGSGGTLSAIGGSGAYGGGGGGGRIAVWRFIGRDEYSGTLARNVAGGTGRIAASTGIVGSEFLVYFYPPKGTVIYVR